MSEQQRYDLKRIALVSSLTIGGFSGLCFLSGRPGDFAGGMIGCAAGAAIMTLVMVPEWISAWRKRRRSTQH